MADQGGMPARQNAGRSNGELARLLGMLVAGGLVAAFAVLNTGQVEVNWVFGTFETPLIVVILVCLAVGILVGLVGSGARARSRRRSSTR